MLGWIEAGIALFNGCDKICDNMIRFAVDREVSLEAVAPGSAGTSKRAGCGGVLAVRLLRRC